MVYGNDRFPEKLRPAYNYQANEPEKISKQQNKKETNQTSKHVESILHYTHTHNNCMYCNKKRVNIHHCLSLGK